MGNVELDQLEYRLMKQYNPKSNMYPQIGWALMYVCVCVCVDEVGAYVAIYFNKLCPNRVARFATSDGIRSN